MKQNINKILEQIKWIIEEIVRFINQNKKKVGIILLIITILLVAFIVTNLWEKIKLEKEKNTDITNAIHAIVIQDYAQIYKKPKQSAFSMFDMAKKGDNVYILEELIGDKEIKWYKVKYGNRVGYVVQESLDYFEPSDEEFVLMSDVSKFNVQYKHFENTKEYQIFLIENNIQYVYIRAGGRGYGEKGNFYTDEYVQIFIEACEYLKIPYGFYYIDEAVNGEEIDEEVEFIEKFIKEHATSMCKLPLAIDIETHDGKGRADEMWENRVFLAEELVQKFRVRGISTIIYSNAKTASEYLTNVSTNFWLAYYPQENQIPNYWYSDTDQEPTQNLELINKMIGWQFTENGVGEIIKEDVDISLVKNSFFKQYVQ